MRQLEIVLALVLATAGLAGCISDGPDTNEAEATTTPDPGPTIDEPNVTFDPSSIYAYDSQSTHEVRWENGSFAPATCFVCPNSEHRIDVTSMLAPGAPNLLEAQVDRSATTFDAATVYVETQRAEVYEYNSTFQSARMVLDPAGGSVEVVVENLAPDAAASLDYELRIQVDSNRSVVPTEVPVALPTPSSPPGLVVEPREMEGSPRLMLWDGEDAFLGHYPIDGRTTINVSKAQGGPLVAYLAGADGIATAAPINASATDTQMRPLGLATQEEAASVSGSNVTIEPDLDRVPLQVGLFLRGQHETGTEYSGSFSGPNGTLVSFESGGYYTGFGAQFNWTGDRGDPGLVPGSYTANFEFSQSTGGEAGAFWHTYQR